MVLPFYTPEEEDKNDPQYRRNGRAIPWFRVFLTGFLGGLLGVLFAGQAGIWPGDGPGEKQTILEKINIVAEDKTLVNLVKETSPGVVSVVITRDVRVRTDPFRGFPFFSDPFGFETPEGGQTERRQVGSGSGFFVSSDGMIVTNKHVVEDEDAEYTITVQGGEEYKARVLARHPANDLALLKVDGNSFPALALGDSDKLEVGQTAIAIGNPLGEFANSVSRGIISGLGRNVRASSLFGDEERLTDIIQTDAAINPGNSGGPLFNLNREVIGVNVAMAQGAENIGFALPVNQIKLMIDQVKQTGRVSVPYIGVRYAIVNDAIQKENNLPFNYGALVIRGQRATDLAVIPGSPASKVGMVENDIILEIDGKKITEDTPLGDAISGKKVGDEIVLKVWHDGQTRDIRVRLEERPQQ